MQINYTALVLAIIGAGGIFTGCNPSYTADEVVRHLTLTQSRFFVADADLLEKVAQRVVSSGLPVSHIFQMSNQGQVLNPNFPSFQDLFKHGKAMWATFSTPEEARSTTAALLSTSGTSGLPKAAMQSHDSFICQSKMIDDNAEKDYEVRQDLSYPSLKLHC